jgi:hypothetical protein
VSTRDQLEAVLRGWNAYELGRGAAPVIDYDLRPDVTDAEPVRSRFGAYQRCVELAEAADERGEAAVAARAWAEVAHLGALLGERPALSDYLRATQGSEPAGWTDDYLLHRRDIARAGVGGLGVAWGPDTTKELRRQRKTFDREEAVALMRSVAAAYEPEVRALTGATAPFHLSVEAADVDAYWSYWLDGSGADVRLRVNSRKASFTETDATQLAIHEILGHGLQSASMAEAAQHPEVPWVRLLAVHAPHQIVLEGLAQILPLLLVPDAATAGGSPRPIHRAGARGTAPCSQPGVLRHGLRRPRPPTSAVLDRRGHR